MFIERLEDRRLLSASLNTTTGLLTINGTDNPDRILVFKNAVTNKIIVNQANPTTSLSKARVSELFLRKTTTWDDGQPVLPVEQMDASPLRETFSREVLGMSASAAQQAASHRGDPPVSVASDREVLAYVRLKPGAIGYISASTPIRA